MQLPCKRSHTSRQLSMLLRSPCKSCRMRLCMFLGNLRQPSAQCTQSRQVGLRLLLLRRDAFFEVVKAECEGWDETLWIGIFAYCAFPEGLVCGCCGAAVILRLVDEIVKVVLAWKMVRLGSGEEWIWGLTWNRQLGEAGFHACAIFSIRCSRVRPAAPGVPNTDTWRLLVG